MRTWRVYGPLSSRRTPTHRKITMRLEGSEGAAFNENSSITSSDAAYDPLKENIEKEESTLRAAVEKKRTAKIHDFCLGIPFGAIVLSGGFIGYLFSRNLSILSAGFLFGAPLLLMSCASLKVWRRGLSSLPFILGQGALAAALFWKHFQTYSLTKKFFFPGLYALLSGAMLFFYMYVVLSGGNPPPKAKVAASKAA